MPGGAIVGIGIAVFSLIRLFFYLIEYLKKRRNGEDTDGFWTGGLGCGVVIMIFIAAIVFTVLCIGSLFVVVNQYSDNPIAWVLLVALWGVLGFVFYKFAKSFNKGE